MFDGIVDSLDEARYEHLILDSRLEPLQALSIPSAEVLDDYAHGIHISPLTVCSDPLGFYQFVRFLKSSNETVVLGGFLRDLAYLQYNHPSQDKYVSSMLLREIIRQYLNEDLMGCFELSPSPKHVLRGNSSAVLCYHPRFTPNPTHHLFSKPVLPAISSKSNTHDHLTYSAEDATEGTCEISLRLCEVGHCSGRTSTSAADIDGRTDDKGDHSDSDEQVWKLHYSGDVSSISVEELLVIGAKAFESITAALFDSFLQSMYFARYITFHHLSHKLPALSDHFSVLRLIGRGAFGKVYAAKHICTGKLYAIKTMDKRRIKHHKCAQMVMNERKFLSTIQSVYVLQLKFAFTTSMDVSLVFDLMMGGSLDYHIKKRVFHPTEALYYTARCVRGIEALHKHGIVFRDLKPQNILLDHTGRSKLVDLGLADRVWDEKGLHKICGTRGYWAPEIISLEHPSYGCASDFFSLGCVLYEMLMGVNPFMTTQAVEFIDQWEMDNKEAPAEKEDGVAARINTKTQTGDGEKDGAHICKQASNKNISHRQKGINKSKEGIDLCIRHMEVELSVITDVVCRDFIAKLLRKKPYERLGGGGDSEITSNDGINRSPLFSDIQTVMSHPYFSSIAWESLDWIDPPFKPLKDANVMLVSEIGDFGDAEKIEEIKLGDGEGEGPGQVYEGWTYRSREAMALDLLEYLQYVDMHGPFNFARQTSSCCTIM